MPACNVDKFVLFPSVDYFVDVAEKKLLPHQQSHLFTDVAVTFFMPHPQKSQHRGVKQNCQHCNEAFSIFCCCKG
jgi:hypothetical protein